MIAHNGERNRKTPSLDIIGYMAGTLFILLGLFPKVSGLLSAMPPPVMGAILISVSSFMNTSGKHVKGNQAFLLKASIAMSSDCGRSPACARTLRNKASVVAAAVWPDWPASSSNNLDSP